MTLVFVTNYVHHHQLPVADEFNRILGNDYHYIATKPLPDWLIKGGYDPTLDRSYIIRTYANDDMMAEARHLIDECDVVIMGDAPKEWATKRNKNGKVTFYFLERIYKKKKQLIKLPIHALRNYFNYGRYKNTFLLCASAFTAHDFSLSGCFIGKSFRWGYITTVDSDFEHDTFNMDASSVENTPLMWCARFLVLKHPELPVQLASRLKAKGYDFTIDMFGSGEELERIQLLINELGVEDCVHLCGNLPNADILKEMRKHSIFLFTSDRNEGWGAVLNESMANGCVPVASNAIGSAPYLIKDGENGLLFQSCNLDSLETAVCSLLDNKAQIDLMSKAAIRTMRIIWSPRAAAENFIDLAQHALNGTIRQYRRLEGPASWENKR